MVARAIRTAGECGRVDLLPAIGGWLDQGRQADPAIRYWSAWSAILLGDEEGYALGALQSIVLQPHAPQRDALRLLCLWLQDQQLRTYLQNLPQTLTDAVLLVEAIGWSGQAGSAAWLIEQMRIAPLARAAGESFRLITGFDFEDHQAVIEAPPSQSESDQAAPYAAYPYPDADKVATWWQANQDACYKAGSRLLLGRPITLEWLTDILEQGEQAHRELAALHHAVLRPGNLLAPTHAHAMIQWLRVQQLKESES